MGITNTKHNLTNSVGGYKGERERILTEITVIENGQLKLPELKERVTKLDALIAAAEMILQESYPDFSADAVAPRRKTDRNSSIPYGILWRTAMEVMGSCGGRWLTVREITDLTLERLGHADMEPSEHQKKVVSIGNSLKSHEGDQVESDGERLYAKWRLIRRN